jgi:hypothetical protein
LNVKKDSLSRPDLLSMAEKASSGEAAANGEDNALAIYNFLSHELRASMGHDFLGKMPMPVMEKYCVATVLHDHPTADLLYQLMVNFMSAYAGAETNEEALKAFDYLAHLADK